MNSNKENNKNLEIDSTNYCFLCKKRLKLITYSCKCNQIFCVYHCNPEVHNCSFNYKELGKEIINKNNPVVFTKKLQKLDTL